jgi:hypothetical protein
VLKIFQTLVDRKGNLEKLSQPTVEPATDLINQKANANKQVQVSVNSVADLPDPSIIKQK